MLKNDPKKDKEEQEERERRQQELDEGLEHRIRAARDSNGLVSEQDVMNDYNYEKTLDNPFDYYR